MWLDEFIQSRSSRSSFDLDFQTESNLDKQSQQPEQPIINDDFENEDSCDKPDDSLEISPEVTKHERVTVQAKSKRKVRWINKKWYF